MADVEDHRHDADDEEVGGVSTVLATGTLVGACAWLLGYCITFLSARGSIEDDPRTEILRSVTQDSLEYELIGWLHINAHGIPVELPQVGVLRLAAAEQNFVTESEGLEILLLLVPPFLLAGAGALVVVRHLEVLETTADAALVGATVVFGYLLLVSISLFVFAVPIEDDLIRPDPFLTILLAGILYPVVCGGIGGALARVIQTWRFSMQTHQIE